MNANSKSHAGEEQDIDLNDEKNSITIKRKNFPFNFPRFLVGISLSIFTLKG